MRTKLAILALLSAFILHPSFCFAQGSLTPPGAPAPTMKSLAQIEPRTPIASLPITITNSGSYYLTTNIAVGSGNAITIATNGVTLDLNGFTISSTEVSPTGTGILLGSNITDITILNGHIKGGIGYSNGSYSGVGFANGIYYSSSPPLNVKVTGISVSGCLYDGIHLGTVNSTVVESCTVLTVGGYGIVASGVFRSTAKTCGSTAISADSASDCNGGCTGSGNGLDASFTAHNCIGSSSSGYGLNAATANNCYGLSGTGRGLVATTANNSYGLSFNYTGMNSTTANNCYGYSYSNAEGISASTACGCYGQSVSGPGISAAYIADSCYGFSGGGGIGIYGKAVQNSYGSSSSWIGIYAETTQNCYGLSNGSGGGIVTRTAQNCSGFSMTAEGIYAEIAIGCFGLSNTGTGLHFQKIGAMCRDRKSVV